METKNKKGLKGFNLFIDEKRAQMLAILFQAAKDNDDVMECIVKTATEDFQITPDEFNEFYSEIHSQAAKAKFKDSRAVYGISKEEIEDARGSSFSGRKSEIKSLSKQENATMDNSSLKPVYEAVARLGKNEVDGFFLVSEHIDEDSDSVTTNNVCKVTNTNADHILRTVVSALQLDHAQVKRWATHYLDGH